MSADVSSPYGLAVKAGNATYLTGRPCKYGHVTFRFVANRTCSECAKKRAPHSWTRDKKAEYMKVWRKENVERRKTYRTEYRKENLAECRAAERRSSANLKSRMRRKGYRLANSQAIREWERAYKHSTLERSREVRIEAYKRDPKKFYVRAKTRKMLQNSRIPIWADLGRIEEIYRRAGRISKCLGVPLHVDHVVPIKSRLVSGLHCEANLAIISGRLNSSKGNRTWPDKGYGETNA